MVRRLVVTVGSSQVHICQRLSGTVYYATLFDTTGRRPVYSAFLYKYRAPEEPRGNGVDRNWKYEPQLVNPRATGNMTELSEATRLDPEVRRRQAVLKDAVQPAGRVYVRVLLNAANLQGSRGSRSAAYTVTNALAAPRPFYHQWKVGLKRVLKRAKGQCAAADMHLVSGSVRSPRQEESWLPAKGKGRAALPQLLWMAFCCGGQASGALLGYARGSGTFTMHGLSLGPYQNTDVSLAQLDELLAARMGRSKVHIFKGGCAPP
ncbi:endonuclease domain-containing 1 protein-like [Rhinoraja longicauda]